MKIFKNNEYFRMLKEKLSIINKPNVNVRLRVVIITILVGLFLAIISTSYALWTINLENSNKFNIIVGTLSYNLTSSSFNANNQITVQANNILNFQVELTSNNNIDSKYSIYYEGSIPSGAKVSYKSTNSLPSGEIGINGNKVTIDLVLENPSNTPFTVKVGVEGGFTNKELSLDNPKVVVTHLFNLVNPTLTVSPSSINLSAGDSYDILSGVSAKDMYGKDITSSIKTTGIYDSHKMGNQTIEYSITDSYGQTITSSRTITVNPVYVYNYVDYSNNAMNNLTGGYQQLITTSNNHNFFNGGYFYFDTMVNTSNAKYLSTTIHGGVTRTANSFATKNIDLKKYKYIKFLYIYNANKFSYIWNNQYIYDAITDVIFGCFPDTNNLDNIHPFVGTYVSISGEPSIATVDITNPSALCKVGAIGYGMGEPVTAEYSQDTLFIYQIWLE
ncbi:MAG: DUF5011 domain-containing protein [Bacilli bacterium]